MSIYFNEDNKTFHLQAKDASYIINIFESKHLTHLYWGKKIRQNADVTYLLKAEGQGGIEQEYPAYGNGNANLRNPAYQIQLENGTTITELTYKSHKIYAGKPKLQGLPSTYIECNDEAQTLEITLEDSLIGLQAILSYTAYEELNAITRNVKFINNGNENLKILRALSANVDFKGSDFELLQLSGAIRRERHIVKRKIQEGMQGIESRNGFSGHNHNPFIALLKQGADEYHGDVYGFSLVYSGNFTAQVELDSYESTRVNIGINPFDFSWTLEKNESFQTPEVVMVYSDSGIGKMSNTYHDLYRTRLCRGQYRDKERPVLINNWEATYFDFNHERIVDIAKQGKEIGCELFVLDDGWFGQRNDDSSSLGDWYPNKKLSKGIDGLAKEINEMGMLFGLWFEPEMVSPNSDLYRAHPDWCIHVPNRSRSQVRNQLILDLSRDEVCEYIIKMLSDVLSNAPITYVKWDMNRNMSEIGSATLDANRQRETAHRYILGLYRVMETLTTNFPNVLFEGCASGGGRFDPGILHYMPQIWTSDASDAVERLFIQYGTSIVYPISTMGAHVTGVPNHQVHRSTSLKIRGDVAISGNFGYELDLTKASDDEKQEMKKQIRECKEIRHLTMFGDFHRIISPFESNETCWMFVSKDKNEVMLCYYRILAKSNQNVYSYIKLKGLDEMGEYKLLGTEQVYGGDTLMNAGINIKDINGDFVSTILRFERV